MICKQNILNNILSGYLGFLKGLLKLAAIIIVIGITGSIVTFPLWYIAVNHTRLFTFIFTTLIVLLAGYFFIRSIYRKLPHGKPVHLSLASLSARFIKKTGIFLISVVLVYGLVLLYVGKIYFLAIPGTFLVLFIIGYIFFYKRNG